MFMVEINAKAEAEKHYQNLIRRGYTEGLARRQADRWEAEKVARDNKWITENVGLD